MNVRKKTLLEHKGNVRSLNILRTLGERSQYVRYEQYKKTLIKHKLVTQEKWPFNTGWLFIRCAFVCEMSF